MSSIVSTDPASRSAASWAARLAAFKSRGVAETDVRVIECREALAYHRLSRAVSKEYGQLSRAGADRLRSQLSQAVS